MGNCFIHNYPECRDVYLNFAAVSLANEVVDLADENIEIPMDAVLSPVIKMVILPLLVNFLENTLDDIANGIADGVEDIISAAGLTEAINLAKGWIDGFNALARPVFQIFFI